MSLQLTVRYDMICYAQKSSADSADVHPVTCVSAVGNGCSDVAVSTEKLAFKVPSDEAEQHCMPSEPGRKRKLLVRALFRLYTVLS